MKASNENGDIKVLEKTFFDANASKVKSPGADFIDKQTYADSHHVVEDVGGGLAQIETAIRNPHSGKDVLVAGKADELEWRARTQINIKHIAPHRRRRGKREVPLRKRLMMRDIHAKADAQSAARHDAFKKTGQLRMPSAEENAVSWKTVVAKAIKKKAGAEKSATAIAAFERAQTVRAIESEAATAKAIAKKSAATRAMPEKTQTSKALQVRRQRPPQQSLPAGGPV